MKETWKYGLIGGIISLPLTLGVYYASGMGNELSLNMVFVGGFIAGVLARNRGISVGSVGFRAGVIGGVPGVWIFMDLILIAAEYANPPAFRIAASVFVMGIITIVTLSAAGIVGFIGAKIGAWLSHHSGEQPTIAEDSG